MVQIETGKDHSRVAFEAAVETVREEDVAKEILCGPDRDAHVARLRQFVDAGYDQVYVHQIGPDQEGFFCCYEREVLRAFT